MEVPWLCGPASRRVCPVVAVLLDDTGSIVARSTRLENPEEKICRRGKSLYWMRSKTLKIGMYSATIIPPTMPPRNAIMSGSMSAVSASVVASTSWS